MRKPEGLPTSHTGDRSADQRNLDAGETIRQIQKCPLIYGRQTGQTYVVGTGNVIHHKLGRQPQGWIQTDVAGGAVGVHRTAWDDKTITLTASTAGYVDLWVY